MASIASYARIQMRSASGCTPNCLASHQIGGFGCDAASHNSTPRARTSSEYFLKGAMDDPSHVNQTMIEHFREAQEA
jgi:hypothetical protein